MWDTVSPSNIFLLLTFIYGTYHSFSFVFLLYFVSLGDRYLVRCFAFFFFCSSSFFLLLIFLIFDFAILNVFFCLFLSPLHQLLLTFINSFGFLVVVYFVSSFLLSVSCLSNVSIFDCNLVLFAFEIFYAAHFDWLFILEFFYLHYLFCCFFTVRFFVIFELLVSFTHYFFSSVPRCLYSNFKFSYQSVVLKDLS